MAVTEIMSYNFLAADGATAKKVKERRGGRIFSEEWKVQRS
jgi:hypothetical protein